LIELLLLRFVAHVDEADQLDAIRASGGVVGVNFAVAFLRADGHNDPDTPVEEVCRHVEHLVGRMGIDHVALGSDFEGATVPHALAGPDGFAHVLAALGDRGWSAADLDRLSHGNWLRVLRATWKS